MRATVRLTDLAAVAVQHQYGASVSTNAGTGVPGTVRPLGRPLWLAAVTGAGVGLLGGLVGLGGIGVVAAIMGVAGGELLIPTIVLLYGGDTKLAGSLSLLVSLPTMLVAFFRYSRDQAFTVLGQHPNFIAAMAGGSIAGTFFGALLLGSVSEAVLAPLIVGLLLFSAFKVWRHA